MANYFCFHIMKPLILILCVRQNPEFTVKNSLWNFYAVLNYLAIAFSIFLIDSKFGFSKIYFNRYMYYL